jgi:hypothetical protein
MRTIGLALAILFGLCPVGVKGETFGFDDIACWVGTGANEAALAIDWDGSSSANGALVWGYRWSGTATGQDMLFAVAEADPRLYLCYGSVESQGKRVYGLGYDLNDNGVFGIRDTVGNTVTFPSNGVVKIGVPDGMPSEGDDAAHATDPNDLYREGWYTGFWCYSLGTGDANGVSSWTKSVDGAYVRTLSNGFWDGWAFCSSGNPRASALPDSNLSAASAPEPAGGVMLLAVLLGLACRYSSRIATRVGRFRQT